MLLEPVLLLIKKVRLIQFGHIEHKDDAAWATMEVKQNYAEEDRWKGLKNI